MPNDFFGALGNGFAARNAAELKARLGEIDTEVPRRTKGRRAEHRERYCIFHYLRTLQRSGLVRFPFQITKSESPDFRIEMGPEIFGLEHAEAGNEQFQQAATLLEQAPPGSYLEGHRIVRPGMVSKDQGYIGDEPERLWTVEVLAAIKKKAQLLPKYEELADYQLLLYDSTEVLDVTGWSVTELPERLAAAIQEWREAEPEGERRFSRISVLRDRVLMYDVTGSTLLLPVPPSPSLPRLRSLTRLGVSEEELQTFSERHGIRKLGFFGSVSEDSDRFGPQSDVDVLVELGSDHRIGLFGIAGLELELSDLLGRRVDLRTVPDLSRYFREEVVREKTDLAYAHAAG